MFYLVSLSSLVCSCTLFSISPRLPHPMPALAPLPLYLTPVSSVCPSLPLHSPPLVPSFLRASTGVSDNATARLIARFSSPCPLVLTHIKKHRQRQPVATTLQIYKMFVSLVRALWIRPSLRGDAAYNPHPTSLASAHKSNPLRNSCTLRRKRVKSVMVGS